MEETTIRSLRTASGMTQNAFSTYLGIPLRTIEDWDTGKRTPPPYIVSLIQYKLTNEGLIPSE